MKILLCAALAFVPVVLPACQSSQPEQPAAREAAAPAETPPLQFRVGLQPGDTGYEEAERFVWKGGEVALGPARVFEVARASVSTDYRGFPAVHFELTPEDGERFRAWTGSIVDMPLAILIEGEIVTLPTVNDALPGAGVIDGGIDGFTAEEAAHIVELISPG